jgi:DnaK suppressor protein
VRRELARVNGQISNLRRDSHSQELEGAGDNTPLSEAGDAACAAEQRAFEQELLGNLHERAARLERALARVQEDKYGRCARCGLAIHPLRLRALPEAELCVLCAARFDTAGFVLG